MTDVNSTGDGKQRLLAPPTAARCPGRFGPPAGYPYPPSPYTATVVVTYELTGCEAQTTTRRSNAVLAHRAALEALNNDPECKNGEYATPPADDSDQVCGPTGLTTVSSTTESSIARSACRSAGIIR